MESVYRSHSAQHMPLQQKHGSAHPGSDQVVLLATGKKRKRLQRACEACHKAKRRCDGGLPCSNCDFSGRACSYSDSQGKAVAPTKRTLKPSEAANVISQPTGIPTASSMHGSPSSGPSNFRNSSHSLSPSIEDNSLSSRNDSNKEVSRLSLRTEPSLESRRELLCIFFSHLHPLNSAFDEISFLRDLSSLEVPWVLLYAIYAVSADFAHDYHRHHNTASTAPSKYARLVGETGDGRQYASEARRLLYREAERNGDSLIDGTPSLEVAQALYLLSCFEFSQGRIFRASSYIQASSKHVNALQLHLERGSIFNTAVFDRADESVKALQGRNARRLLCLVATVEISISIMNGETMSMKSWEMNSQIDAIKQQRQDDDENTLAIMQLLQIASVLNSALELSQKSRSFGASFEMERNTQSCQQALLHWAEELPESLRFDEAHLAQVGHILNDQTRSRSPTFSPRMSKTTATCWMLMHTMAETTTLVLSDIPNRCGDGRDKLAACNNLIAILQSSTAASLPRLFASVSIAVLYSSSRTPPSQCDEQKWSRMSGIARDYANSVNICEEVWMKTASWWSKTNENRRLSSATQRSLSPLTKASMRMQPPSPPSTTIYRRPVSSSPHSHSIPLPGPPPTFRSSKSSKPNNYHHLPPLANFSSTSVVLPPLRSTPPEITFRPFWDQPQRSTMSVNYQ